MAISEGEQAVIDAIRELKDSFETAETRRTEERRSDRERTEREPTTDGGTNQYTPGIAETREGVASLNQAFRDLGSQFISSSDIANNQLTATFGKLVDGVKDTNKAILSDATNVLQQLSRDSMIPGVEQMNSFTELAQFIKKDTGAAIGFGFENLDAIKQFGVEMIGKLVGILDKALENFFAELRNKFITGLKNLVVDVYNFERGLERTLGITEQFSRTSTKSFDNVRKFIGKEGLEQVNKSYSALFRTFTDFTFATEIQKQRLTEVGAVLDTLGYSVEKFAEGTHLLTKALGLTEDAAAQTQLSLAALAMDIGVSPEQMAQDFVGAGNAVAKLGSQGEVAFRRLAIAAKVTGIEVGRLIQMTEKFDTFDGAAEQAGKLNAALGGNFVNAMDLMTATDPVERFNMIRDSIKNAGLSFDTMSYYQKNFYKDALGLNDVGELANMLSGNMDSLKNQIGKTSDEYEEMAKRAARTQKIQDFLNTIFHNFLEVIEPAVDYLKDMANTFTEDMIPNLQKTKKFMAGLIGVISAVSTGIAALAAVAAWALTPFSGGALAPIAAGLSTIAASLGLATTGMVGFGMASIFGSSTAEALGEVFDALKEAFYAILESFSLTGSAVGFFSDKLSGGGSAIKAFASLIKFFIPTLRLLARMLDIIIFALGVVGTAVGVVLGMVGFVIGSIAGGINGLIMFFYLIVDSVGEVVGTFLEMIAVGAAVGGAIGALGGPFAVVGAVIGGVIGFFGALFDLLFDTPFNPPSAFQGILQFAGFMYDFGSSMLSLLNPISLLSDAFEFFFSGIFDSFGILRDMLDLLLQLAETDLANVNETFDSVSNAADSLNKISLAKMAMLTAGSTANSLAQSVDSVSQAVTTMAGGGNEKPIQINLTIEMDGEKFAKKVVNITDREISTRRRIG